MLAIQILLYLLVFGSITVILTGFVQFGYPSLKILCHSSDIVRSAVRVLFVTLIGASLAVLLGIIEICLLIGNPWIIVKMVLPILVWLGYWHFCTPKKMVVDNYVDMYLAQWEEDYDGKEMDVDTAKMLYTSGSVQKAVRLLTSIIEYYTNYGFSNTDYSSFVPSEDDFPGPGWVRVNCGQCSSIVEIRASTTTTVSECAYCACQVEAYFCENIVYVKTTLKQPDYSFTTGNLMSIIDCCLKLYSIHKLFHRIEPAKEMLDVAASYLSRIGAVDKNTYEVVKFHAAILFFKSKIALVLGEFEEAKECIMLSLDLYVILEDQQSIDEVRTIVENLPRETVGVEA